MARDVVAETEFLVDRARSWKRMSDRLYEAQMQVVGRSVPTIWGSAGALNEAVHKMNSMTGALANLVGDGKGRTEDISDRLREVVRAYILTEEQARGRAEQLEAMLNE